MTDPARVQTLSPIPPNVQRAVDRAADAQTQWRGQAELMRISFERQSAHAMREAQGASERLQEQSRRIGETLRGFSDPRDALKAFQDYVVDAGQRAALTLDALRKRGDLFLAHEAAGAPPVLIYDYEIALDGRDLPRPCNYMLLKITPPAGVEVFDWKRPYMIIDPRAGHGAGIGGFKPDSQVGVALRDGHPVYFVAFRPIPEPGQTLADVTHAEAAFLREVRRLHPEAPQPIVVGNCQGGWATAILAARNPDLTGPIVLNGAPMSYWAGRIGRDMMRYAGGVALGALPALVSADLGGGKFDGADLVLNFEMLNPGRTWFRKYFDLYADFDEKSERRFLEFEKWWGGFYLMNEAEIRWILENLFIGNRLGANEARLETGRPIDLKAIRAPIIVFASHGDNITPPQQALNWIVDTYADETEIEIRGQRIIYMVHEEIGHLGIFVSSSVARREHAEVTSTLKTIEALPPGLFEMVIKDMKGEGHKKRFTVDFFRRKMTDLLALGDDRSEERAFAAVARFSELSTELYDTFARPAVQAVGGAGGADARRKLHPMRIQRSFFASQNPLMAPVTMMAEKARAERAPTTPENPFRLAERLWASWVETSLDAWRDLRIASFEAFFLTLYANPVAMAYAAPRAHLRARRAPGELRGLPEVREALERIEEGGAAEAIVRMLVLLADARGDVRRDRLERSAEVLSSRPPFAAIAQRERAAMIHQQSLIAHFEPEAALKTLESLLPEPEARAHALELVSYVVGDVADMEPRSYQRLSNMRRALGFPPLSAIREAAE